LTIEPNTYFAKHPPAVPDEDSAYEMLDLISAQTADAGLQRYEVSAYARPGHRCFHNWNYWQFGDYLGIGAGAHGKLSFAERVVRQVRWRDPQRYMEQALLGQACASEHEVTAADLPFEFMLNALRLREGFPSAWFSERTGLPITVVESALQQGQAQGWLERDFSHIRPTEKGFDFLSNLQELFLPPHSA
jgi:oxygen-independent coproporphyrinogen-3 oxidase